MVTVVDTLYRQLPLLTPDSDWRAPTELPDLRGVPELALDTETRDDALAVSRGPGWAIGAGYVAGVSWDCERSTGYAPIRHPDTPHLFPKENVGRWLTDIVKSGTRLIFQNGPYDLGWMWKDLGVDVPPEYPIDDAQCMNFMLDENEYQYNLDVICERLGIPGKDEALLTEAGAAYLRPANALRSWKLARKELKANLWRLPARYVGPYAEADANRARLAVLKMRPQIEEQNVEAAYRLEMDLIPTVREMRARGIRIDTDRAEQVRDKYLALRDETIAELARRLPGRGLGGVEQLRQAKWLEAVFEAESVRFPRTKKTGQGSFQSEWMEKHPHWLPPLVSRALACDRFANYFMQSCVLDFCHDGRLHAEVNQYKSDDGGTITYRFAYSNPPLQQSPRPEPKLSPDYGTDFRSCFVADGVWGCNDYSQQEYRLIAHFADVCGVRGGREAVEAYRDNPDMDIHQYVADLMGLSRSEGKIQNFAIVYGEGIATTAAKYGVTVEEMKEKREILTSKAPFGPALDEYCKNVAQKRGYLKLIDGARVRFPEWEAAWVSPEEYSRGISEKWRMEPCSKEEAEKRRHDERHPWHGCKLRRAGVRKSLNKLIQGSAARQTKMAMRECRRVGLITLLQMHDELNHDEDSEKKIQQVAEIMRTVVPLRLPVKVDTGCGANWAEAKSKG